MNVVPQGLLASASAGGNSLCRLRIGDSARPGPRYIFWHEKVKKFQVSAQLHAYSGKHGTSFTISLVTLLLISYTYSSSSSDPTLTHLSGSELVLSNELLDGGLDLGVSSCRESLLVGDGIQDIGMGVLDVVNPQGLEPSDLLL